MKKDLSLQLNYEKLSKELKTKFKMKNIKR